MQCLQLPATTRRTVAVWGPNHLASQAGICAVRAQPLVLPRKFSLSTKPALRCVTAQAAAEDTLPVEQPKEGVAHLKHIRGSASKFRRVLDQLRGRSYEEALMILEYLPYRACEDIMATLISAASNAKNNAGASKVKLYVSECFADQAGLMKRFQPRAKGRPFAIHVQRSHITIRVAEREEKAGKKSRR